MKLPAVPHTIGRNQYNYQELMKMAPDNFSFPQFAIPPSSRRTGSDRGTAMCITSPLTWPPWMACCPSASKIPWSGRPTASLTPSHARNIQQYLEDKDDWLLGSLLLGIAPDALEFDPYQDDRRATKSTPTSVRLSILTGPGEHDADI